MSKRVSTFNETPSLEATPTKTNILMQVFECMAAAVLLREGTKEMKICVVKNANYFANKHL